MSSTASTASFLPSPARAPARSGASRPFSALLTVAFSAAVAVLGAPRTAHAWIDTSIASVETKVEVAPDGMAAVENTLTLRIKGGPFRSYDIPGFDADAIPEGDATATPVKDGAETGPSVPILRQMLPDGALRLSTDDRTIARGNYVFRFKHRTALIKTTGLERDGNMVRLRYLGPKWPGSLDGAKCTFLLEPGASEPRPVTDRVGEGDGAVGVAGSAFLSTVRRKPGKDEIDLVRAHVSRGEPVGWSIRVDPTALAGVTDAKVLPLPATRMKAHVADVPEDRAVLLSVALGVALLFTALMGIKCKQVATACLARHADPRPLLPSSAGLRVLLTGPIVAGGVLLQLFLDAPLPGTAVLVLAMLVMAHRAPLPRPQARGPGRWLPVSDEEAFVSAPEARTAWLDVSTRAGKIVIACFALVVAAASFGVQRISPYHAWLLALDAIPFLVLFCTGLESQLPPDGVRSPKPLLSRIARELRASDATLRVVPLLRFAQGSATPDELRLLVMPKQPVRGLSSIEIGVAYSTGESGALPCPEVLVRTVEDSVASKKLSRVVSATRWVKGKKPGERVFVLEPKLPTWRMTKDLARRLSTVLAEPKRSTQPEAVVAPKRSSRPAAQASSAASSAGRAASTKNAFTRSSPVNPTEAACSA